MSELDGVEQQTQFFLQQEYVRLEFEEAKLVRFAFDTPGIPCRERARAVGVPQALLEVANDVGCRIEVSKVISEDQSLQSVQSRLVDWIREEQ